MSIHCHVGRYSGEVEKNRSRKFAGKKGGKMKIIDVLLERGCFSVLADQYKDIVRLWTLSAPFQDGRTLKALQRFFPDLEVSGRIIILGRYKTLAEAHHDVAQAKVFSSSKSVQSLFRFDTEESLKTIKSFS